MTRGWVLTDRGLRLRNAIVGLTLTLLLVAFLGSAFAVGQAWKQSRLEQETSHGNR